LIILCRLAYCAVLEGDSGLVANTEEYKEPNPSHGPGSYQSMSKLPLPRQTYLRKHALKLNSCISPKVPACFTSRKIAASPFAHSYSHLRQALGPMKRRYLLAHL
jgi:hypothetical protein